MAQLPFGGTPSSLCAESAAMSGSPDRSTGVQRARARALLDGKSPWEHSRAGVGHPTALDFLSGACEPRVEQKEN